MHFEACTSLEVVVAAVLSGAVFGDHCSPFSDTTIVTSIACEVEPHDHVRTQLPYALITAAVAALLGFLPAGLGVSDGLHVAQGGQVAGRDAGDDANRRLDGFDQSGDVATVLAELADTEIPPL